MVKLVDTRDLKSLAARHTGSSPVPGTISWEDNMDITQRPGCYFIDGIPISVPNEIRQNSKDFYVSYNGNYRDYGCPTTALVLNDPQMSKFFILKGDHRRQYEEAGTYDACLRYYLDHPELQHEYSDKV